MVPESLYHVADYAYRLLGVKILYMASRSI